MQVVKEDRGTIYAILPFEDFLELIEDPDKTNYKEEENRQLESERMQGIEQRIQELS